MFFYKTNFLFLQDSKETKPYLVDVIKSWLKPKHDSQHFHVSNKQFSKTSQLKCHINKQVFICINIKPTNQILLLITTNSFRRHHNWKLITTTKYSFAKSNSDMSPEIFGNGIYVIFSFWWCLNKGSLQKKWEKLVFWTNQGGGVWPNPNFLAKFPKTKFA